MSEHDINIPVEPVHRADGELEATHSLYLHSNALITLSLFFTKFHTSIALDICERLRHTVISIKITTINIVKVARQLHVLGKWE